MIAALQVSRCVVFYDFLRIEAFVYLNPAAPAEDIALRVVFDGPAAPPQTCRCIRRHDNGACEMALEALIDRAQFPAAGRLVVCAPGSELVKPLAAVCAEAQAANRRDALTWDCLRPAIAAMAVGTPAIPAVDTIVGPGNIYVTLAKRRAYGRVNLDMLAGPSEVLVIADRSADQDQLRCALSDMGRLVLLRSALSALRAVRAAGYYPEFPPPVHELYDQGACVVRAAVQIAVGGA